MENSVIEKKFKKLGTKELRMKLLRGVLSSSETEIVKEILDKRENGGSYKAPDFEKESQETIKKIAEEQKGGSEASTEDVNIKPDKPKAEKKKRTARTILTEETSASIKKIVDDFKGGKKELIFHLFESGFTKQQLSLYRPQFAHHVYIYKLAQQFESNNLNKSES
jgi:hypothetical protein